VNLNPVETKTLDGQVQLQSVVEHSGRHQVLWYSFENNYEPYLTTEKLDGFLVAVLPLAMKLAKTLS
jgi:hypothetical protein